MYPKQQSQKGLPKGELVGFIASYLLSKRFDDEDEATDAAIDFIDFCKGRAWVLTDVGSEIFGFTHRTFLEYFAASQLVRLSPSADALYEELFERIVAQEWDVVAQLAVQILGRTVEDGADDFLQLVVSNAHLKDQVSRLNVASFAARSLTFIVPRPPVLRDIVDHIFSLYVEEGVNEARSSEVLGQLTGAAAENLPLIEKYLADAAERSLRASFGSASRALLVLWYTWTFRSSVEVDDENRQYWKKNRAALRERAKPHMKEVYRDHSWVAVRLWADGDIELSELLSVHGLVSLYERLDVSGSSRIAPFATTVVGHLLSGSEVERFDRLAKELNDSLVTLPTPWISARPEALEHSARIDLDPSPIAIVPSDADIPSDATRLGAVILLGLPYLELRARAKGGHKRQNRLLDAWGFLLAFRGGQIPRREGIPFVERLGLESAALEFVLSWAERRVSVLAEPR
ncbi:hypothetical protein GCM10022236_42840 [Microlunatus ginsengisoli]|uniref:Uncharacterized protein n=2 Tax=Microlunatus ginsengisoli TaxID=363863 RepID=A0ABP7ALP3_9ACTN